MLIARLADRIAPSCEAPIWLRGSPAKLEWAVAFVALIVVGFVARHDSNVVAARDAST
jgi:hypothetical protein